MQLRHLQYLIVLAKERHFARAAAICNITQSTLSSAIRALEDELGAPIIERNRRFRNLTAEGDTLLKWSRRILAERDTLTQQINLQRDGLSGMLRIGVIPAALAVISLLNTPFRRAHPNVRLSILSLTSREVESGLDDYSLDAGVTYLDNEPLHGVRTVPLYCERYILLTPQNGPFGARESVHWREVAEAPLCLLAPGMQNRRILDSIFKEFGGVPEPAVETNSVMTLCSHVREGSWSSVLPHSFLWLFGVPPGLAAIPLIPKREQRVGVVVRDRNPWPPVVAALMETAATLDLQDVIDASHGADASSLKSRGLME